MDTFKTDIEPGSVDSILPDIIKTGNKELDNFYEALTNTSTEDFALLMIALSKKEREADTLSK